MGAQERSSCATMVGPVGDAALCPSVGRGCDARWVGRAPTRQPKAQATDVRRVRTAAADGGGFFGTLYHGAETLGALATVVATLRKFDLIGGGSKGRDKRDRKGRRRRKGGAALPVAEAAGKWPKLAASIAIDAIGASSYALPGIGEAEDVAWAPISAALLALLYGNYTLTALDLVEEGLPFTDAIPTACLAWSLEFTPLGDALPFLKGGKGKAKAEIADEAEGG